MNVTPHAQREEDTAMAHALTTARRVVFVAAPPVQLLDVVGPYEVFSQASRWLNDNRPLGQGGYCVEVVTTAREPLISSSCGLRLGSQGDYRDVSGPIDTLLVVGGEGARSAPDPDVLAWLRDYAPRVRRLGSVCTGAFVLAAAGLLDGRHAVTHWRWCAQLAHDYPQVQVETDPIYLRDGNVYTSAGITAGMDLALALVEEDFGTDVALQIARELVLFLRRPGGQSQFSRALARQQSERRPLRDLHAWIMTHLDQRLDVETLAQQAAMSPRHFARVFAQEFSVTPARYVEQVRVEAARQQLEGAMLSVAAIAKICGFGSADSMRRSFLRVLQVTPQEYRERFHGVPNMPDLVLSSNVLTDFTSQ